jgi:hypothetical protein
LPSATLRVVCSIELDLRASFRVLSANVPNRFWPAQLMTVYLAPNGWHPFWPAQGLGEHQKLPPQSHPRTEAPPPASDDPVVPAAVRVRDRVRIRLAMGKSKSKGAKFAAVKKIISKKTVQK